MYSLTIILAVGVALATAQYHHQPASAPNPYQNTIVSSITQDTVGNFGYATADGQSRQQVVAPDGSVRGRYSYIDANGRPVNVNYVADKFGYRAAGDNVPVHAQHVPPPQAPNAYNSGQYVHQPTSPTYNTGHYVPQPSPPAYTPPAAPAAFPAPAPAFPAPAAPAFPFPYQAQAAKPAGIVPPHHRNPVAEQQLVNTITQHQQNDQRAQAAQLQQLDAITRQNPAFQAAAHHYPYAG